MLSSILSVILISVSILSPFILANIIIKFGKTNDFHKKYGTLSENMKSPYELWNVLIVFRWLLSVIILIECSEYPSLQMLSLLIISYLYQIYFISKWPYNLKADNYLEIFNQIMVSIYLLAYMMVSLSTTFEQINEFGYLMSALLIFTFLVNFFNVLSKMMSVIIKKWSALQR